MRLEPLSMPSAHAAPEFFGWRSRWRGWWQRCGINVSGRGLYVAALIPGLAHLLCRERRGWWYLGGVLALLVFGILLFPTTLGQLLIGLAAGVHAYSIFSLTPYSQNGSFWVRLIALVLLSIILSLVLYYPLVSAIVPPERMRIVPHGEGRAACGPHLRRNSLAALAGQTTRKWPVPVRV